MRGNNIHFARATVHRETIPGDHLHGYMMRRYEPRCGPFGTHLVETGQMTDRQFHDAILKGHFNTVRRIFNPSPFLGTV
jgi:hypothetical protein